MAIFNPLGTSEQEKSLGGLGRTIPSLFSEFGFGAVASSLWYGGNGPRGGEGGGLVSYKKGWERSFFFFIGTSARNIYSSTITIS